MKRLITLILLLSCSYSCSRDEFLLSINDLIKETAPPEATPVTAKGFITTWSIPLSDLSLTIPVHGFFTYEFTIDWGDNTPVETYTNTDLNVTHLYTIAGNYDVTITGDFPYMGGWNSCAGDNRLTDVKQWGDIKWLDMRKMFCGSSRVNFSATDAPDLSQVTDMSDFLREATAFNSNINHWNVSYIQDFSGFFQEATVFNSPLNNWNIGNALYLDRMFHTAETFNQNINSWNTSQVVSMNETFRTTFSYNQPLNNWNVSNVQSMSGTFFRATKFNQPLNNWEVLNVTSMFQMFKEAYRFNQALNSWDVSNVVTMAEMFSLAHSFDQPLNNWVLTSATDFTLMFERAWSMTQDLSCWNVRGDAVSNNFADAKNLAFTLPNFGGVRSPNCTVLGALPTPVITDPQAFVTTWKTTGPGQTITIPLSNSWSPHYSFKINWGDGSEETINQSGAFPHPAHTYTTAGYYHITISEILNLSGFAQSCYRPNFPHMDSRAQLVAINQWGTNPWEELETSFCGASNLNILATDAPDLSNVTSLAWMFDGAVKLNSDLNHWNVSTIRDLDGTFSYNYSFNGPLNNWNTSNVLSMYSTFQAARVFNQDINSWDVSNVTNMGYLFYNTTDFNQPLNNWDTGNLGFTEAMFYHAINFDQSLRDWDTSQIYNANSMFYNAHNFNQNISCWNVAQFPTEPYDAAWDEYFMGLNGVNAVGPIWGTDGSSGTCSAP